MVSEVLPLFVLARPVHRWFRPGLAGFFGSGAGWSASVVNWLTQSWREEQRAFARRSMKDVDYGKVWLDGVHFNVRLERNV
jgi:hypothetical protein